MTLIGPILGALSFLFTESPEDRAIKERDALVQRARERSGRQEDVFIPTNR